MNKWLFIKGPIRLQTVLQAAADVELHESVFRPKSEK